MLVEFLSLERHLRISRDELLLAQRYLDMEKRRLGDRLEIDCIQISEHLLYFGLRKSVVDNNIDMMGLDEDVRGITVDRFQQTGTL